MPDWDWHTAAGAPCCRVSAFTPPSRNNRAAGGADTLTGAVCAGAFSTMFRSSPSRPIGSESTRTRRSSISPCHTKTWSSSTRSTRPMASTAPSNASGVRNGQKWTTPAGDPVQSAGARQAAVITNAGGDSEDGLTLRSADLLPGRTTQDVNVILERPEKNATDDDRDGGSGGVKRQLRAVRSGLVPWWAKDRTIGSRILCTCQGLTGALEGGVGSLNENALVRQENRSCLGTDPWPYEGHLAGAAISCRSGALGPVRRSECRVGRSRGWFRPLRWPGAPGSRIWPIGT